MNNTSDLKKAIQVMTSGGIVIYPTDTAYGMGCRIDHKESVDRLYKIKKRSVKKAVPILVSSIDMALAYFQKPNDIVRHLIKQYWPGALTIISICNKKFLYSPIRGGGNTIGIRMPDHEVPLSIIQYIRVPIIGTSANISDEKTPFHLRDIQKQLVNKADFVIEGKCKAASSSTVVDCTKDMPVVIRQGAVKLHVP